MMRNAVSATLTLNNVKQLSLLLNSLLSAVYLLGMLLRHLGSISVELPYLLRQIDSSVWRD